MVNESVFLVEGPFAFHVTGKGRRGLTADLGRVFIGSAGPGLRRGNSFAHVFGS